MQNQWIPVDVLNQMVLTSNSVIGRFLEENWSLFVLSCSPQSRCNAEKDSRMLYFKDVTVKYSLNPYDLSRTKNSCILENKVESILTSYMPIYCSVYPNKEVEGLHRSENNSIIGIERAYVPQTSNEFKTNKHYILENMRRKYQ